jgi:outer membrane protein assembly complex protein YaeT
VTLRVVTMRGGCVAAFLAVALLYVIPLHPPPCAAQRPAAEFEKSREVRRVEIHGNRAFSTRRLRGFLRTRGKSFWHPWRHASYRSDFLRFDRATLQSYYRRRGYLAAQVDSVRTDPVEKSGAKVDVAFFLTEGPLSLLSGIGLEGTAPLAETEVRKVLKQKPGDPADIARIEADRQAVEDHYANLGYASVQVGDSVEVNGTQVRVVYRVVPGVIAVMGKVGVEGQRVTSSRVVTRELTVHTGDILSRKKLADSQQRIYDTGLYSDVVFERGDIDSVTRAADLHLTVRERKMAWVDAGLGYGTLDQLRLTSEWGHRNIGHEGIRFVVSGRMGIRLTPPDSGQSKSLLGNRRVDATLSEPWIFGTRTRATLGAYAEQEVQTQTGDRRFLEIPLRAYGAALAFRRDLSLFSHGTVSFEHRHVISDSSQLPLAPGVESKSYTTRRVALSLERDTRVDPFDPKAGSDLIGNTAVAGGVLKGSARFLKFSGSATKYIPIRHRFTLAMRIQSGYVNPFGHYGARSDTLHELDLIPLEDRFVTGGASSVRGYFENEIGFRKVTPDSAALRGGEILLQGSIEARFPLVWVLGGAAFVDAGNVWERPEDITLQRVFTVAGPGAGYSDMRWSVGAGLRIRTPVGPLRFDYGWKLRRARPSEADLSSPRGTFHFSLGQAF